MTVSSAKQARNAASKEKQMTFVMSRLRRVVGLVGDGRAEEKLKSLREDSSEAAQTLRAAMARLATPQRPSRKD